MANETNTNDVSSNASPKVATKRRLTPAERDALRLAMSRVKVRKAVAAGIYPEFPEVLKRNGGKVVQIRNNNDL